MKEILNYTKDIDGYDRVYFFLLTIGIVTHPLNGLYFLAYMISKSGEK